MNAIQAFVPSKIVQTFAAFLEFCYVARRNVISDDSLKQLDRALCRFHEARQVFSGTVRTDGPSAFSLPRQHAMVHYHDHIENFGSPNGLCSSITESKHITAVKRPWRWSNKHIALPQILKCNERLDKLAAARADFTARGMLVDSCLIQAIEEAVMDCDDENLVDEVGSDTDDANSDTSDEVWPLDTDYTNTGIRRLSDTASNSDDPNVHGLNTNHSGTDTLNDADTHTSDNDNDNDERPHTPRPPSPTIDEDDDCGPVESGPLMNEVRLVSTKGQ